MTPVRYQRERLCGWKPALAPRKVVGPTREDPPVGFFVAFHFLILSSHSW